MDSACCDNRLQMVAERPALLRSMAATAASRRMFKASMNEVPEMVNGRSLTKDEIGDAGNFGLQSGAYEVTVLAVNDKRQWGIARNPDL